MISDSNNKEKIDTFTRRLAPFLKNNVHATISEKQKKLFILSPWNDKSIAFRLNNELVSVLNNLLLPPRFTAIYHLDSNSMEFIYTLLKEDDPYASREFKFILDGKSYQCQFAPSSERLLVLGKLFIRRPKYSPSDYRHLLEIREYVEFSKKKRLSFDDPLVGMKLISFFVSGFSKFDEEKMVDVAKHLNFYMLYYDRGSPYIIVHSPEYKIDESKKPFPIIEAIFPKNITTRSRNSFLLDLALTAYEAPPRLQFIYFYQILEYAAFYYVEDESRKQISNIINTPDIHANLDIYLPRLIDAINL